MDLVKEVIFAEPDGSETPFKGDSLEIVSEIYRRMILFGTVQYLSPMKISILEEVSNGI